MFVLRSAFWLVLAFAVIQPGKVDIGATAGSWPAQIAAAGQQTLVAQLVTGCPGGICSANMPLPTTAIPVLSSSLPASVPMQDLPAPSNAPVPQPRLARAG